MIVQYDDNVVVTDQEGNPKGNLGNKTVTSEDTSELLYYKFLFTTTINNQFYTISYLDNWLIQNYRWL